MSTNAKTANERPLWGYPAEERMRLAREFLGERVRVASCPLRKPDPDLDETIEGRVVAVTTPPNGNTSALLVLAIPNRYEAAVSLATVLSIAPLACAGCAGESEPLDEEGMCRTCRSLDAEVDRG